MNVDTLYISDLAIFRCLRFVCPGTDIVEAFSTWKSEVPAGQSHQTALLPERLTLGYGGSQKRCNAQLTITEVLLSQKFRSHKRGTRLPVLFLYLLCLALSVGSPARLQSIAPAEDLRSKGHVSPYPKKPLRGPSLAWSISDD